MAEDKITRLLLEYSHHKGLPQSFTVMTMDTSATCKKKVLLQIVSNIKDTKHIEDIISQLSTSKLESLCKLDISGNRTLITYAAQHGHTDVLRLLSDKKINLNEQDKSGSNAIHRAVSKGHMETVDYLLEQGQGTMLSITGISCLHLAVLHNNIPLCTKFFESKNNVGVDAECDGGFTSLHIACIIGMVDNIKMLLENGANINKLTDDKLNPLMLSILNQQGITVNTLLNSKEYGLNVDLQCGSSHLTGLHLAVMIQNVGMVTKLLASEADNDVADIYGSTALHKAVSTDNNEILMMLLSCNKVTVDAIDKEGKTPMYLACEHGQLKIVQLLLTRKADPYFRSEQQIPPILAAIKNKHKEVAYFITASYQPLTHHIIELLSLATTSEMELIARLDFNIHVHDEEGSTILHIAASSGNTLAVERLLKLGVQPMKFNNKGNSPLMCACQKGHLSTAIVLSKVQNNINHMNKTNNNCLTLAIRSGKLDLVSFLICHGIKVDYDEQLPINYLNLAVYCNQPKILENLLSFGAPICSVDSDTQCALHVASRLGNFHCLKVLVDAGAPVNKPMESGDRALHLAAQSGCFNGVVELLKAGAQVNTENRQQQKAIHLAALEGHASIVEVLLDAGSNIQITTVDGFPRYDLAKHNHVWSIVKRRAIRCEQSEADMMDNLEMLNLAYIPERPVRRRLSRLSDQEENDMYCNGLAIWS